MENGEMGIAFATTKVQKAAEKIRIDIIGKSEKDLVGGIVDFRNSQTPGSRLAEYITGLRPDDPKMAARLIEDQQVTRGKYGLPDWFLRYNDLNEYRNCLDKIIKNEMIDVRSKAEYGVLFDKVAATAISLDEKNIAIDINNRDGEDEYRNGLQTLEHELVHAMQAKRYPGMPVEIKEYEAYVAEKPVVAFEQMPDKIEMAFFEFSLRGSIEGVYAHNNDVDGTNFKPLWKDPMYFLKNIDGLSDEQIESVNPVIVD